MITWVKTARDLGCVAVAYFVLGELIGAEWEPEGFALCVAVTTLFLHNSKGAN